MKLTDYATRAEIEAKLAEYPNWSREFAAKVITRAHLSKLENDRQDARTQAMTDDEYQAYLEAVKTMGDRLRAIYGIEDQ